ncbi:MAG: DUF2993 domain-containing protein [Limnochordia bacterium]|nr:DUF2993 domain-containing protein [Bacillota bacterium]
MSTLDKRWPYWALALLAVGVLAASQIVLPSLVANHIEQAFHDGYPGAEFIQVQVAAWPALKIITGRFDRLHLDARLFSQGGLEVDAFLVDAKELKINPAALREGVLEIDRVGDLQATVLIREEALNEYLWAKVDPARFMRIELARDQARLVGEMNLFQRTFDLSLDGRFEVLGRTRVGFVVEQLTVEKLQVPKVLLDTVQSKWNLAMDFSELPVPVALQEVRLEEDSLYVFGTKWDGS